MGAFFKYICAVIFLLCSVNISVAEVIRVNVTSSQYQCDPKFLSVTLGVSLVRNKQRWLDFSSQKVRTMARALAPAVIRFGGTDADLLLFDPTGQSNSTSEYLQYILTGEQWKTLASFFEFVGWDVIYDLNIFIRNSSGWIPSNASSLLNFSEANGINILGFQLGNEVNAYPHNFNRSIPPMVLVNDYRKLHALIHKHAAFNNSVKYGPDVSNLFRQGRASIYFSDFIEAGACRVMEYLTYHHYYIDGRTAAANDFLNAKVLNNFQDSLDVAKEIMSAKSCTLPLSLTETSSCYGGGAPGLSDRYIAGFMWLDKLGLAASYGVAQVFRQTFFGGNYALINSTLDPTPDYFLSVLYKKLVQGPVLKVLNQLSNIRLYANCVGPEWYQKGGIVVYYLNLRTTPANLTISLFNNKTKHVYLLTPGDSNGLTSRSVKLNKVLLFLSGSKLPTFEPKIVQGPVTVEAQSFGFIVVPNANVTVCLPKS